MSQLFPAPGEAPPEDLKLWQRVNKSHSAAVPEVQNAVVPASQEVHEYEARHAAAEESGRIAVQAVESQAEQVDVHTGK